MGGPLVVVLSVPDDGGQAFADQSFCNVTGRDEKTGDKGLALATSVLADLPGLALSAATCLSCMLRANYTGNAGGEWQLVREGKGEGDFHFQSCGVKAGLSSFD